jgi:hypothetical protein
MIGLTQAREADAEGETLWRRADPILGGYVPSCQEGL